MRKKSGLNCEMIWKIWKKSKLNRAIYPRAETAITTTTTTTAAAAAVAATVAPHIDVQDKA